MIHVVERLVLAGHPPDERVGFRAHPAVHRPRRADDRLLVAHHDVPRLVGLAHQVEHHLIIIHVQIQVHLHAPLVRVRRHRVPHRTGCQGRQAHHQLAAFHHRRMDVLVDHPLVALLVTAQGDLPRIGQRHQARLATTVRRRTVEVEFRRMLRVFAREQHLARSLAHVQRVALADTIGLAVQHHRARTADVDDPQLPPL